MRPQRVWGVRKKKFPKTNPTWAEEMEKKGKKGEPEFATLVSPGTGRDEKGRPMRAPSIHPHGCSGGCWFNLAPRRAGPGQYERGVQLVEREITKIGISHPTSKQDATPYWPTLVVSYTAPSSQFTGCNALRPGYYPKHVESSRFCFWMGFFKIN